MQTSAIPALIGKFYHSARIALAFNMPDNGQFPQQGLLTGYERDEILACCRTLPLHVACLSDYLQMILWCLFIGIALKISKWHNADNIIL